MIRIAIIIGSTRPGRKAEAVARWVHDHAGRREDATFELVDIADFDLPHLDEPVPPMAGRYSQPHTHEGAAKIGSFDAYVFVTPEYNHSTSGALKNAIDFLFAEWNDKAAGFVSYGASGGGVRAVEHLRLVMGELKVADVRSQVTLSLGSDWQDYTDPTSFAPGAGQEQSVTDMLDELVAWGGALQALREPVIGSGATEGDTKSDEHEAPRPTLEADNSAVREATEAVARFVEELQAGIDRHDAEVYNRHFAADVLWGSPFGETVHGYEPLHAIHARLQEQRTGGPSSRYEIDRVLVPATDVAVAHVRRVALDLAGQPLSPTANATGAFSEMALYVMIRRGGTWWLAAGQNTPVRPGPPATEGRS